MGAIAINEAADSLAQHKLRTGGLFPHKWAGFVGGAFAGAALVIFVVGVVAEMLDVWGRPVGNGVIRSSHEGIVLGRTHGVYFYPGQPILTMAVRDGDPLTAPYPDTYQ